MCKKKQKAKEEEKVDKFSMPHICTFGLKQKHSDLISDAGFFVYRGSLGPLVRVSNYRNEDRKCLAINNIPPNLHEYDILIFDLNSQEKVNYNEEQHTKENLTSRDSFYLLSSYPQTLFDPVPHNSSLINRDVSNLQERDSVVIIFAGPLEEVEYEYVKDEGYLKKLDRRDKFNNYSFINHIGHKENKPGKKITLNKNVNNLNTLLNKFISQMSYFSIFYNPKSEGNESSLNDKFFVPLMFDRDDELVSFAEIRNKQLILVFPELDDKGEFLRELLEEVLPEIIPSLFPDYQKAAWTKRSEYYLPNTSELMEEKNKILAKHESEVKEIESRLSANNERYSFLHRILIDTGDELVTQVKHFLEWLGFVNVIIRDEEEPIGPKEEDISIEIGEELLIIEVKGIIGTSKDYDCAQISKVRARRCEERHQFDVYALYIVNHQRHLPPLARLEPPFSESQIKDAQLGKRGLISTWSLFNLYFNIEVGVISKKSARADLLKYGLIEFELDLVSELGKIDKALHNGNVGIIKNINSPIDCIRAIFVRDGTRFKEIKVEEIQVNDKSVSEAIIGDHVGIRVNQKLRKGDILFIAKE